MRRLNLHHKNLRQFVYSKRETMAFVVSTPALPCHRHRLRSQTTRTRPCATLTRRKALLLPLLLLPTPALADRTYIAARRSFDRYHPRILDAIDTIKAIRDTVSANDAQSASALITDKLFDVKARRAFKIYATSFSDNYLGERSRAMLKSIDELYRELEFVAKGDEMTVHYEKAVERLQDYYTEARLPMAEISGLGM